MGKGKEEGEKTKIRKFGWASEKRKPKNKDSLGGLLKSKNPKIKIRKFGGLPKNENSRIKIRSDGLLKSENPKIKICKFRWASEERKPKNKDLFGWISKERKPKNKDLFRLWWASDLQEKRNQDSFSRFRVLKNGKEPR
ncbi:unnamed protein product [Rhizophagus irregularis]|nr:unnamed protein product [Rhizophagus irregularis]